ncbi:MAG: fatty acid CoA ligase family protein [Phycisphaerae bacterium]|nr:AMP-binding protein [Phycisphaerales bacterium]
MALSAQYDLESAAGTLVNVADILQAAAHRLPDKPAIIVQRPPSSRPSDASASAGWRGQSVISFRELNDEVDRFARGLSEYGIDRGMRTILMVKPGIAFFVLTFALFKIGAVPVLIDPGMGRKKLIQCLEEIEAEAFVGIPLAHVARVMFAKSFRSVRKCVTVGRRLFWGGANLKDVRAQDSRSFETADVGANDLAAILFTSGSTGPAKGVAYEHGMFAAQVRYLASHFKCGEHDTDVATFPLFALFDVALGMTAIIPDMNPSMPGHVNPERIVSAICDHDATQIFGSPALLARVVAHCEHRKVALPTLRRVLTAGAPIPPALLARLRKIVSDDADIFTPYGATESLPVASIESREVIGETAACTEQGAGICVGRVLPGMELRIIEISDEPIEDWTHCKELRAGEIGEICVRGPVVTKSYFRKPAATRLAKIAEGDTVWHRMGDVGYLDDAGRLWFCGRKAHRVRTESGTLYTIPCEAVFNTHPQVARTALVGVGDAPNQKPVLCVEVAIDATLDNESLKAELLAIGAKNAKTAGIRTVLYHPLFPVDVRHNAKINREALALWASRQLQ